MNHRLNEYEGMTNLEVTQRYRLDRGGIDFLLDRVGDDLKPKTLGTRNVDSLEKVLIALRYYASGELQINDGDLHQLSQPTVSRAVTQVTNLLASKDIVREHITFPLTPGKILENSNDFKGIANFPNVIGVIDGTQIQIQAPRHDEDAYVNRMGYHSINTQIIFDGQDRVVDLMARWPGSTHDSRMLRESGVYQLFEGRHVPIRDHGYLLGDIGYPCKKWLLTLSARHPTSILPLDHKQITTELTKLERGIGQVKRRWGVLHSEIRLQPEKVCKVIMACGVLHNICKERGIPMVDIQQQGLNNPNNILYNGVENGLRYRDFISNNYS